MHIQSQLCTSAGSGQPKMAPTTDKQTHALYLALICTCISITNINIAHVSNKGQIYNDGALSCCCPQKGLYGVSNLKFTNLSPLNITSNKYMLQYINCRTN